MTTPTRINPNVAPHPRQSTAPSAPAGRLATPSPRPHGRGGGRLSGRRVPGRRGTRRRTRRARHRERAHRGRSCAASRSAGRSWPDSPRGSPRSRSVGPRCPPWCWARAASPCWRSGPRPTPPSTGSGRRSCSHSRSGWPCTIHRDLGSRPARWLLYPAIGAMGLAAVGGAYQTVGTAADASSVSMPGRLVDVGGHRLHLNCTGTGSPTVVARGRRRRDGRQPRLDHPGRGPRHHDLRLRPRRPRLERGRRHPPGRPRHLHRPAHPAPQRRGARPLRHGRPLLRRPLRADLRSPPPRRGRRAWCSSTPPHLTTTRSTVRRRARRRPAPTTSGPGHRAHLLRCPAGLGPAVRRDRPRDLPPREQAQVQASTATRGHPAQHPRGVREGERLDGAGSLPARLRRQAPHGPQRRRRQRRRLAAEAGTPRRALDRTACTASSTAPATRPWWATRRTPPPPARPSSRWSPPSAPGSRCRSDSRNSGGSGRDAGPAPRSARPTALRSDLFGQGRTFSCASPSGARGRERRVIPWPASALQRPQGTPQGLRAARLVGAPAIPSDHSSRAYRPRVHVELCCTALASTLGPTGG